MGGQTGDECIRACVELRKTDGSVNGVTVHANNEPGCWCEKGMIRVNVLNPKYKTCFLTPSKSG